MARFSSGFQNKASGVNRYGNKLIVLEKTESTIANQNLEAMRYNNTAVRMYKSLKSRSAEILRFLDRAVQIDPFCDSCHLNKAVILYKEKQYSQALKSCNQAIRINPQNAKSYFVRAKCNLKLNLKEDARYDYKVLCELGRIDFKTLMKIYKEKRL